LGALDEKLRRDMQVELKQIQRTVGTSFVYVTHDQQEALSMSDRIVVMNGGLIEQIGSSEDVYEYPTSRFVAGFLGTSNLLEGTLKEVDDGYMTVETAVGYLYAQRPPDPPAHGTTLALSVRPERIALSDTADDPHHAIAAAGDEGPRNRLVGTVRNVVYKGGLSDVTVGLTDGSEIRVGLAAGEHLTTRDGVVTISWPAAATRVLTR
jgi:spermidine/putrescine transport system ATP-binding protein